MRSFVHSKHSDSNYFFYTKGIPSGHLVDTKEVYQWIPRKYTQWISRRYTQQILMKYQWIPRNPVDTPGISSEYPGNAQWIPRRYPVDTLRKIKVLKCLQKVHAKLLAKTAGRFEFKFKF